jgi:hypothetical protein
LEQSSAARKMLERKIASLKSELRIQTLNAARQPILHEALEQDRIVRPKLVARTAADRESATAKGGTQQ